MSYLEKIKNIIGKQRADKDRQPEALQTNLDHLLQLRLSELAKCNIAIQIYSAVLGCEIWLCSSEEMAAQLRQDDPEAVTYTVDELRKLYKLQPFPEDLRGIHNAKTIFPGSKIIDSRLKETNCEPETDMQDH